MKAAAILDNGKIKVDQIDDGLESLQEMVGGYIELIPCPNDERGLVSVFGNEEARLIEMPPSALRVDLDGNVWDVIHGPLVALGGSDENGDCTSLSEEGYDAFRMAFWPIYMQEVMPGVKACLVSKPNDHPAEELKWPDDWPHPTPLQLS